MIDKYMKPIPRKTKVVYDAILAEKGLRLMAHFY
jgi:hypothetical protein